MYYIYDRFDMEQTTIVPALAAAYKESEFIFFKKKSLLEKVKESAID